jgi:hypothetical protein
MAFEHKPGSFSLFKNKDKQEGDNRPSYNGEMIRFAVWLKKDKNGATFMSGKMEPPRSQGAERTGGTRQEARQPARSMSGDPDDSIPFLPEFR